MTEQELKLVIDARAGQLPGHGVDLSDPCRAAFHIWRELFPKLDRFCPIVEGFMPTATWEVLGRVDACTVWGTGGWMLTRDSRQVQASNHRWTGSKATKTCKATGERGRCFVKDRESTGVMELLK